MFDFFQIFFSSMKQVLNVRPIDRLKKYLNDNGITDSACEKRAGISNGYINKSGKGNGSIGSDILAKLVASYPDLSLFWLVTGKNTNEMNTQEKNTLNEPALEYGVGVVRKRKTDAEKELQLIPFYNVTATAGVMDIISDENRSRQIPIDYIKVPNMPKCDGALPITGDSMYPLLKSGDIVLFKEVHDKHNIIWGEMYLAAIKHNGDEFFFSKYIQKSDRDGYARFVSENRHHQPVEFPIDSIEALALIKASIRFQSPF